MAGPAALSLALVACGSDEPEDEPQAEDSPSATESASEAAPEVTNDKCDAGATSARAVIRQRGERHVGDELQRVAVDRGGAAVLEDRGRAVGALVDLERAGAPVATLRRMPGAKMPSKTGSSLETTWLITPLTPSTESATIRSVTSPPTSIVSEPRPPMIVVITFGWVERTKKWSSPSMPSTSTRSTAS